MKNYFYSVLAASMLFACSQEEIVDVTKGEGQQMTFKVEVPGIVQSRAIADGIEVGAGKYANTLLYAMYEENQNEVLITNIVSDENNDGTFEISVPMAKDIKYDLLFLAYNVTGNENKSAFVINSDAKSNNLKALKLKSDLYANQETYDAFIGHLDSQGIDAAAVTTVELQRPFAQVNVATTLEDLTDMATLKSEVVASDFMIYGAPNTLNVFTGEVSGSEKITYKKAEILKKYGKNEYPYNELISVDSTTYYYLGMTYVLAGKGSSTHDASFKFYREDDKQVSNLDVVGMPVQANYRTNILGTILTKKEDYEIKIDTVFGEPANVGEPAQTVVVNNKADLVETIEAAPQNGTPLVVVVDGDITLGNTTSTYSRANTENKITIPANAIVKIDLNGHNIVGTDEGTASFGLINLNPGSNLSIINSSVTTEGKITLTATQNREWNAYSSVISNQRATLTVGANVVVEHLGGTDMAYGIDNLTNTGAEHAKTTIEGATIKSTYRAIRQFLNSSATGVNNELYVMSGTIEGENKSIWMQDANTSANPGKLIVSAEAALKGNVFLSVTAGSTEWPVEVSIAASALKDGAQVLPNDNVPNDYQVVENDGVWTVKVKPVAKIGDTVYETLDAAVAAAQAGSTITLNRDVTLSEELQLPAGIIFNGNGNQINGTIYAGGDLTFVGHTKVTSFSASYYNRTITIGEGACLEVTGTGRVTLGYGNTFNITGSITDAKTADKANIQPSLIIPGGISITGGNDAAFNVTNAFVKIGSTTSKPGVANGEFTLSFNNSIVEFTKELGFYEPTGGMNPAFKMNIKNSVFTTGTKLFVTTNSEVDVDNSTVTLGSYIRNSGKFTLENGSVLTGATIQFGENGGNNGTITVDNSTLTVTTGNNKGNAFDGKGVGKITLKNNATASVEYYKAMTIECDATSTFTGTEVQ